MRCHYEYVKGVGRVLIPGCMAVAVSGEIKHCTCHHSEVSYRSYDREAYQKEVRQLKDIIRELREENDFYAKILEENEIKNPYERKRASRK